MTRLLPLTWALLLGACFTGSFASGLPCAVDGDCGPDLRCAAGVCGGGPSALTTGTGTAPTTGQTTTSTEPATITTLLDETTLEGTTGETCGIGRCKDFDILFIADNSLSMFPKTLLLLDFIQTFGNVLVPELRQACSVHIGVTTTDTYSHNPDPCRKRGALVQANKNGKPCTFIESKPYATLPDLANPLSLQCIFDGGADGDRDERPIDAFFTASGYDPDLNATCNAGFYRPEAFLTALFVTDEDDDNNDAQGNDGSGAILEQSWPATLSNLKGSDDIYLVGLFGKTADQTCEWDPATGDDGIGYEDAPKLRQFLQSWPAERLALDTMCNRIPNGGTFEPLLAEIRTELRAACGA